MSCKCIKSPRLQHHTPQTPPKSSLPPPGLGPTRAREQQQQGVRRRGRVCVCVLWVASKREEVQLKDQPPTCLGWPQRCKSREQGAGQHTATNGGRREDRNKEAGVGVSTAPRQCTPWGWRHSPWYTRCVTYVWFAHCARREVLCCANVVIKTRVCLSNAKALLLMYRHEEEKQGRRSNTLNTPAKGYYSS